MRQRFGSAALSWAIDRWAQTKLSARERRALRHAREQAVADLHAEAPQRWSPVIQQQTGMPGPDAAMRLLEPMRASSWRG